MVSIVVPTLGRDSFQDLAKSLPVVSQSARVFPFEVIVVADAKVDAAVVADLAKQWSEFTFVQAKSPGVNCARNLGAAQSSGEIIWFLDDDVEVPQATDALRFVFDAFRTDRTVAIGGGYLSTAGATFSEQGYNLLSSLWRHVSGEHENEAFLGGCFLVRKQVFHELGGFDEAIEYGGAETRFVHRLRDWSRTRNRRLLYESRLDVFHRPRERDLAEWFRLAFRQGIRAQVTDGMRPPIARRLNRANEFIRRMTLQERLVLLSFCVPYLGVTRVGRLASFLLKSK